MKFNNFPIGIIWSVSANHTYSSKKLLLIFDNSPLCEKCPNTEDFFGPYLDTFQAVIVLKIKFFTVVSDITRSPCL